MKNLLIEWKHFDKNGATCDRCSQTGSNLDEVIKQLKDEYRDKGINIQFQETKLTEDQMSKSNQVLINGELIENLISNTEAGENYCDSCTDLVDNPKGCNCRTIIHGEIVHEEIPLEFIKQAITNYLSINRKEEK